MSDLSTVYILKRYFEEEKSLPEIAQELNTYPNKIRRIILKAGRQLRDKSESQKIALNNGRADHPTEGKERTEETKLKLSEASAQSWANMPKDKKKKLCEKLSESFKKRDKGELEDMYKKASRAISEAGRSGSKLEKYLLENLPGLGYNIIAHKKGLIANTNLEPDFVIPDIKVVIEIDGPTHFLPIFGEERLEKTIKSDTEKNGLFLQNGYCVLRVKHICKTLTAYKKREALKEIAKTLDEIKNNHKVCIIEIEV
jgi:very-short-patch-repair endonuclease